MEKQYDIQVSPDAAIHEPDAGEASLAKRVWGRRTLTKTLALSALGAACRRVTRSGKISEADAKNPEVRKGIIEASRKALATTIVERIRDGSSTLEKLLPGEVRTQVFDLEMPMNPDLFQPPITQQDITLGIDQDIAVLMNQVRPLQGTGWSLSVAFKPWVYDSKQQTTTMSVKISVGKGPVSPPTLPGNPGITTA